MQEKKQRLEYVDAAKFTAMYFVIAGHLVYPLNSNIFRFIFAFHMPVFFFLSGYTAQNAALSGEQLPHYVLRKAKAYLIPYFVLSFVGLIWTACTSGLGEDFSPYYYALNLLYYVIPTYAAGGVWFLSTLFLASVMMFCILKLWENRRLYEILITALAVMFISGTYINGISVAYFNALPFQLGTVLMALSFMLIGFIFRRKGLFENKPKIVWKAALLLLPVIVFKLGVLNGYVNIANQCYGVLLFYFAAAYCGIIWTVGIGKLLKRFKPLLWLGKNTLPVFAFHGYFITPAIALFSRFTGTNNNGYMTDGIWVFVFAALIYLACIPFVLVWNFCRDKINKLFEPAIHRS